MSDRDILLAPVVSEKAYGLLDENKYTFLVAPDANKTQIKIAVEKVFGVKVISVNTMKGVVTLSGSVDSSPSSDMAKVLAGAVSGVKEVKNRLVIKPIK